MKRTQRLRLLRSVEALEGRDCPTLFGNAWLDPNLTLSFAADGTSVQGVPSTLDAATNAIPGAVRNREILRAFQSWVNVANVNIGVVADDGQAFGIAGVSSHDPRFGDVRVAAVPLAADDVALALPFDPTAGTRAGDLLFNSSQPFGMAQANAYDLYSIALHEAGHVFGLAGSTDPNSSLYSYADRVRTGLGGTDVADIRKLYGERRGDAYEGVGGNETTATAARLQPNGPGGTKTIRATADLTTTTDADVFTFKAEQLRGGAYLVRVQTSGLSLVVPRVEALDAKGNVLASQIGAGIGAGDVSLRLTNLKEGDTYTLRVTSTDATFAVGGYRLTLKPESDPGDDGANDAEVNGNDSAAASTSLDRLPALNGTRENFVVAGTLSSTADVDYYRLRPSGASGGSAGILSAGVVVTDGLGIDPVLEILDRNQVKQAVTVLVHDGGEYRVQLANADANRDYYVVVRHGIGSSRPTGNYTLGIDFGGPAVELPALAAGELTASGPANTSTLTVTEGQVLHIVLAVEATAVPSAVRVSLFDAGNRPLDSRPAAAGETTSFNVFLRPGTYQLLVGGGTTSGAAMPTLLYVVRGGALSDPIGPRAIDAATIGGNPQPPVPPPVVPAPVAVTPPRPATPTQPVVPTAPNILLLPPTDLPTSPTVQLRPVLKPPTKSIAVGVPAAGGTAVKSYNADGTERFSVVPFPNFSGTLRTAEADVNNDGIADLLVGTGAGSVSRLVLIDGRTQAILFVIDPFEAAFTGGVFVAAGDVTGDDVADLIVTPDRGGGPRVRIFNGATFTQVADFFGIDDPAFRGGARAAVGDVNADGTGDLIVSAGFEGGPRVAGYDGATLTKGSPVKLFADFFAFEPALRNGAYVAAGDIDGDGRADLIAGGGPGGGPRVTIFSGSDLMLGKSTTLGNFFDGDLNDRNGIRVAVKTLDGDNRADLIVGVGNRVFGYAASTIGVNGTPPRLIDFAVPFDLIDGVFVG